MLCSRAAQRAAKALSELRLEERAGARRSDPNKSLRWTCEGEMSLDEPSFVIQKCRNRRVEVNSSSCRQ